MSLRKPFKLTMTVLLVVLALALAACGGQSQQPAPAPGGDSADGQASGGDELQPVTIRIVADFPPPPFNAAVAIEEFAQWVEERIPGSEVRSFFAGSLYPSESDALEAMVAGNLEMIFGQYGKGVGFEPRNNIVVQPMNYTTIGALRQFPNTETAKWLADVMRERGIETLGNANLSFYLAIASPERITSPDDLRGKKVRSMDPLVSNAVLDAWGASPITMAFGEVPSALETGTIDGVSTSVGGWLTIKDQAPYYNVLGIGGAGTDYYYIAAGKQWWDSLNEPTREVLRELIADLAELSDQITYCDDQAAFAEYGTDDPSQPGIYILSEDEVRPFREALGTAAQDVLKSELPADAHEWIDRYAEEGRALSEQYPEGSDPLEQTDCQALFERLGR